MAKRPPSLTPRKRKDGSGWSDPHRGSPASRGYGWEWKKRRARILARDRYLCQIHLKHGGAVVATDVDHIISRAAGGSEDDDNLQSLCSDCHKAKTAKEARAHS